MLDTKKKRLLIKVLGSIFRVFTVYVPVYRYISS